VGEVERFSLYPQRGARNEPRRFGTRSLVRGRPAKRVTLSNPHSWTTSYYDSHTC
jgi:hypothetical protein